MNTNQIAMTQSTFDAITRTLASAREAVRCWENFGWSKESQDSIEAMRVCLYQLKDPGPINQSIIAAVDVTASQDADAKQAPQSITITLRQAGTLLRFFGDHDAEVIVTGPAPGQAAGLFAYCAECPDEGCEYLGVTEVDDELATYGRPAPATASLLEEPLQRLHDLLFAAQRTTGVAQEKAINEARIVLYRLRARPQADAATLPIELHGVSQVAAGGGGCWRSCSGCHELNEGHATGPYSEIFECALGNGCDECGGIGAIWDTTDYGAMADHMARSLAAPQPDAAEPMGSRQYEGMDGVDYDAQKPPIKVSKMVPGSDRHLIVLGVPMHYNLLRGRDYQDILTYGRSVWQAALTTTAKLPVTEGEGAELLRLRALVNSPQTKDFLKAVAAEKAHQVERWGEAHDRSKSAESWYWLVGYLAGKCLRCCITGEREKALHHTISTAAALANWHEAISRDSSGAGIGQDADLKAHDELNATQRTNGGAA